MNASTQAAHRVDVLLVEDNPGDVELTQEAFLEAEIASRLHIARDGDEALDYLYRRTGFENARRPDVILLDLNMPRKSGHEVLSVIKQDASLKDIPVIVLSSSSAERDIAESYRLHVQGYIVKPVDLTQFPWWKQ